MTQQEIKSYSRKVVSISYQSKNKKTNTLHGNITAVTNDHMLFKTIDDLEIALKCEQIKEIEIVKKRKNAKS